MSTIIHKEDNTVSISVDETKATLLAESHVLHIEHTNDDRVALLLRAYKNRTRQYNFFKLYSDMLDSTITEEEYDRELNDHEDLYVLPEPQEATPRQIQLAYCLSQEMGGIDSTEDFTSIFSISDASVAKYLSE